MFNLFYVQLLDYSILLKARHDELIHESITLYNHKLIQREAAIMIVHSDFPWAGFELRSLGLQAGILPIEPPLL